MTIMTMSEKKRKKCGFIRRPQSGCCIFAVSNKNEVGRCLGAHPQPSFRWEAQRNFDGEGTVNKLTKKRMSLWLSSCTGIMGMRKSRSR